jgi:Uma2 family endonuclease
MNAAVPDDFVHRHRLTVEEYYRMAEVGLLAPDARVELIEGEIIGMAPIGNRHAGVLDQLAELMMTAVGQAPMFASKAPCGSISHRSRSRTSYC